ncbi:uncharacterized protein EDB91DRAFT_1347384 [Suillus paluster]|uniref:uncharacterized protein n=1 Tax=Suillus paluster TaxID=48578 RepID=UPI001B870990|nr:uncharacterized protein EDB91DRAFT_1347384 [Suillus paluster]KAG1739090.1 hypothetical protein EDB91DRAFT_1347384 [Suillus paluster]
MEVTLDALKKHIPRPPSVSSPLPTSSTANAPGLNTNASAQSLPPIEDAHRPLQEIGDTFMYVAYYGSSATPHHPNTGGTTPLQQNPRPSSISHHSLSLVEDAGILDNAWAEDTRGLLQLEDGRPPLQGQGHLIDDTQDSVHFFSEEFHHPNTDETHLQPRSRPTSISHHGISLVGVVGVQDKGALHVTRRPKRGRWKAVRVAATTPSATPTAGTQSRPALIIDDPTRWTRLWLFLGGVSVRSTNS